jgi:hypothetical protein
LSAEERLVLVKNLATGATIRFLIDLPARLSDALQTAYDESLLYVKVGFVISVVNPAGGVVDAARAIEEIVKSSGEAQRKRLSENVKRVGRSEVMTPTGDRRAPLFTKERLRLAYQAVKKGKGQGERVEQREVARKLNITPRHLRRKCQQELELMTWDEVVAHLEGT